MKNLVKKSLICLSLLSAINIHASDSIEIGQISHGGNGCPQGSADVFLSPDNTEMLVHFHNYEAIAGGVQSSLARKACNMAIPLHIPEGLSVSLVKVDFYGEVSLPKKAEVTFNAETFFVGEKGVKISQTLVGRKSGQVIFPNDLVLETWSKCGEDTILRLNTSLLVKSNKRNQEARASINFETLESGVIYQLKTRACSR